MKLCKLELQTTNSQSMTKFNVRNQQDHTEYL